MGFCWWPAAREGGILIGAWGNKAKRRKAAWPMPMALLISTAKRYAKSVLGGRAWRWWWDRRDLILGKLELGPPSAARVGEHDIPSGAVKPIPVLLQVKSSLEQARNGSKVVPDGDDGVETAWWWRCESLGRPCRR